MLFQPSFLAEHVACGKGDERVGCVVGWWTEHAAYHGTLHRLSVLIGLVDNSPLDTSASQCESRKRVFDTSFHVLNLSQLVDQVIVHLELSLRAW